MDDPVRELLEEAIETYSEMCADNGTSCHYCGREVDHGSPFAGVGPSCDHEPNCWVVRARAILEEK